MRQKIIFWIFLLPLWILSAAFLFAAIYAFAEAPRDAQKNVAIRAGLLTRAQMVETFFTEWGRLPSKAEFEKASAEINDNLKSWFTIYVIPPAKDNGFDFPSWPSGNANFAVGYWRVDWMEFYDSPSRRTTLDGYLTAGAWRLSSLIPLGYSALCASVPLLCLWLGRRENRTKSVIRAV